MHSIILPFTSFRCQNVASEIKKIISRFCPEFLVNICFSTIKLKNIINPKLKAKIDQKISVVQFINFFVRVEKVTLGNLRNSQNSEFSNIVEIFKAILKYIHIENCPIFKNSLLSSLGPEPSLAEKRFFLLKHFKILEKNLTNTFIRKTAEANFINLIEPSLNKQVFHHKMSLICGCLSKKSR